jgi:hypothetical protein
VNFETPNLTEDSMLDVWMYLDSETGDIKLAEIAFPDEIKENTSRQVVVYDENDNEVERVFLECMTHGTADFAVTIDDLAPGNYTFDWFLYFTAAEDYLPMCDEPLEWEQTENVPLRITVDENYEMAVEEVR